MVRRHHADHDLCIAQCLFEAVGGGNEIRYGASCKIVIIRMARIDAVANFRFMRPEANVMAATAAQHDGDGSAPRARSYDGYLAQVEPVFPPPKRFSLPASSRRILSLCRMMINREEAAMNSITAPLRVSGFSHHAATGKIAAASMLPSET